MTNLQTNVSLLAVLILGLYAWWIYKEAKQSHQTQLSMEQRQQARDKARIANIEAALREWLRMLELPQPEEGKSLQEAAHQLCIVLVEKLLSGPNVR